MSLHRLPERSDVAESLKWDLRDLFASEEEWRKLYTAVSAGVAAMETYRRTMTTSAVAFADALDWQWRLRKDLTRLSEYARLSLSEDTTAGARRAIVGEMDHLVAGYREQTAFVDAALIGLERTRLDEFLAAEPRLEAYRCFIANQRRRGAHILTVGEERIMAGATTQLSHALTGAYAALNSVDLQYPQMRSRNGTVLRVDRDGYVQLRASADRRERQRASALFFRSLGAFSHTFATLLDASVRKAYFAASTRHYDSTLALILDAANLPSAVYGRLLTGVRRQVPRLHRYLQLRRRALGVSVLHSYDLHPPLVAGAEPRWSVEEARLHVAAAMAPLGDDHGKVVARAFDERWLDLVPSAGKQRGHFTSVGAYESHPYALLNYGGHYGDLSALACEVGRVAHRFLSSRSQPFPSACPDFLPSETAAMVAGDLLVHHLIRTSTGRTRALLLAAYLESVRSAVFGCAQLGEFELRIHTMAQAGQPLLPETLGTLYLDIARQFHGHDEGVCTVHDYVRHEWIDVPQLYATFSMFQYALAFCVASIVSDRLLSGDAEMAAAYLRVLSLGNSKPASELVAELGVDLLSDDLLATISRRMDNTMSELQAVVSSVAA